MQQETRILWRNKTGDETEDKEIKNVTRKWNSMTIKGNRSRENKTVCENVKQEEKKRNWRRKKETGVEKMKQEMRKWNKCRGKETEKGKWNYKEENLWTWGKKGRDNEKIQGNETGDKIMKQETKWNYSPHPSYPVTHPHSRSYPSTHPPSTYIHTLPLPLTHPSIPTTSPIPPHTLRIVITSFHIPNAHIILSDRLNYTR